MRTQEQIRKTFPAVEDRRVESILESLVRDRLVLRSDKHYLSLALDSRSRYTKAKHHSSGGYYRSPGRSAAIKQAYAALRRGNPKRIAGAASRRAAHSVQRMAVRGIARAVESIVRLNA
jgi:hypothetical protein